MKSFAKLALFAAGCLPALVLAQGNSPSDRPGPSAPVTVTNTSANPVPATGNISVSGTSSVSVDNVVSVVSEDNPALQPVTLKYSFGVEAATVSNGIYTIPDYQVPAGKRLVIEHVDGRAIFAPRTLDVKTYWSIEISGSGSAEHLLGVTSDSAPCTLTQTCAGVATRVRLYANAGARLAVS